MRRHARFPKTHPASGNKIEHRLFSFISLKWRGKPLLNFETLSISSAAPTPEVVSKSKPFWTPISTRPVWLRRTKKSTNYGSKGIKPTPPGTTPCCLATHEPRALNCTYYCLATPNVDFRNVGKNAQTANLEARENIRVRIGRDITGIGFLSYLTEMIGTTGFQLETFRYSGSLRDQAAAKQLGNSRPYEGTFARESLSDGSSFPTCTAGRVAGPSDPSR